MWPIRFRNYLFFSLAHLLLCLFLLVYVVCVCVCAVSEAKKSIEHNLSKLIGKRQLR